MCGMGVLHKALTTLWKLAYIVPGASVCLEYGEKVSEEPFEIPGSSTHPNSTAAHNGRINRKLQVQVQNDLLQLMACISVPFCSKDYACCIFYPYWYHMDVVNRVCPSVLCGKNLTLDTTCRLFERAFSYLPYLYEKHSTILYCFHWSWPYLGVKRSARSKTCLDMIRMKFDVVMKHFKLNILRQLLSKICWSKENNVSFTDCIPKV